MSLETLIGVINQKNHRPYKPSSFKSPAHERAILLIRCWIEDVNTISKIFFKKKKRYWIEWDNSIFSATICHLMDQNSKVTSFVGEETMTATDRREETYQTVKLK